MSETKVIRSKNKQETPVTKRITDYDWVAVIGSREPTETQREEIVALIKQLDPEKHAIISGCADGIDALALVTGQELGFETIGILPWSSYNPHVQKFCSHIKIIDEFRENACRDAYESVHKYHPAPERLSRGAIKLHARNYGIIRWASQVIAAPSNKPGGGGTGQGIRLAKDLRLPLTLVNP